MNRVLHYFPNSDMRRGHLGLSIVAAKNGKDVTKLSPGEFLLFVNRAQTQLKLYAHGNVVAHYKQPKGRIDLRAITEIPQAFSGGTFDFNRALQKVLEKDLSKRGIRL